MLVLNYFICKLFYTYSRISNRRGGRNKQGGWQISAKIISKEGAVNREVAKISKVNKRGGWQKHSNQKFHWNKVIKRSCEKINKKNIRNTKVVYLHEESLVLLLYSPLHAMSCFIVIRKQFCAMWKKQHVQQTVSWLCLGLSLPLSTVHMN